MYKFAEKYYSTGGIDMNRLVPRLFVKFREDLCFKGRKFSYEDVTKFVKRGDDYIPLISLNGELRDTDVVMDMAAPLCIGVAEFMTMLSNNMDAVNLKYLFWIGELDFAKDWYDMLEKANKCLEFDVESNEHFFTFSETLKSSLIDMRFPVVRRMYSALMALHLVNPKSFCIALFEAMQIICSIASMFLASDLDFTRQVFPDAERRLYGGLLEDKLSRFGVVNYTPAGAEKERRISDGRGIGLSLTCLFMYDVYGRYADFSALYDKQSWDRQKSRDNVFNMFQACLGDDYTGRLLRNGRCRVMPSDEKTILWANYANYLAVDSNSTVDCNGFKIGRGLYEGHIMWKYAVGADGVETPGVMPPVDCTYGTRLDVVHACINYCFTDRGIEMSRDLMAEDEKAVIDKVMKKIDIDAMIDSYKREVDEAVKTKFAQADEVVKSHRQEAESAHMRIQELERSLAEKQHIIDELRDERESLLSTVRSTYSEDDYYIGDDTEELVESEVSREEMLDFVNQFRLVLIGGFDTMQTRMTEAGFTNVFVINSERGTNSLVSGDFFCICTRFMSHKLENRVTSQYRKQLDQFFRFNGTNVEVLLRVCYEFMKKWMEE